MFKGSVRENIRFGASASVKLSDAEIQKLAKSVKLSGFLQELPKQLRSSIEEGGRNLSGGQQQKIAILRGLIKEGSILLLDEVTASLDSKSAKEVLDGILNTSRKVTTLMITHKLRSEALKADRIVVLGKKGVIADGSHDTLLKTCALYQKLWEASSTENS